MVAAAALTWKIAICLIVARSAVLVCENERKFFSSRRTTLWSSIFQMARLRRRPVTDVGGITALLLGPLPGPKRRRAARYPAMRCNEVCPTGLLGIQPPCDCKR